MIREERSRQAWDVMNWDVLCGQAAWPMTNVRNLSLPQWRRLAERPEKRCVVPLTKFTEFTPEKHDLGDGKPPLKGEMWFSVTDQPTFAVAGFWQATAAGNGFAMVTCDANELVRPIHPKAMITILRPRTPGWQLRDVTGLQRPYDAGQMTVRGPMSQRADKLTLPAVCQADERGATETQRLKSGTHC